MLKLLTAVVIAGIGLGLNIAIAANEPHSAHATSWSRFQSMVKKCDALTGAEKKQCMMNARDTYRASDFKCESMSGTDKTQCLKYGEQWSATANPPNAPVTHTEEPTTTSANPGDPSVAERNRDSTKQQEDASRPATEPKRQN